MLVTKSEYAKSKGWSKAYLSKPEMIARLEPAMVYDQHSGKMKIDTDLADKILEETKDPARSMSHMIKEAGPRVMAGEYERTRTASARVKLEHEELNLAERKGLTLSRDKVEDASAMAGQIIREYLKGRNKRLAERFSTMTDARKILAELEEEDRTMLQSASDDFLRRIPELNNQGADNA